MIREVWRVGARHEKQDEERRLAVVTSVVDDVEEQGSMAAVCSERVAFECRRWWKGERNREATRDAP